MSSVKRRLRPLTVLAVGTSIGTPVGAAIVEWATGRGEQVLKAPIGYLFDRDCDPVTPEAVVRAGAALEGEYLDLIPTQNRADMISERSHMQFAIEQAAAHGLTVIDAEPSITALYRAGSIDQMTETARQYLEKHGVELELTSWWDTIRRPLASPVDEGGLDIEKYRGGMHKILLAYHYLPRELTDYTDLEQIFITDGHLVGGDSIARARANDNYFPAERLGDMDESTPEHEWFHVFSRKFCGDFGDGRDPEWDDLNTEDFAYGRDVAGIVEANTAEPYGAENRKEDKSTHAEGVLGGVEGSLVFNHHQTIRDKAVLLLARFETVAPGSAEYLVSLNRQDKILEFLERSQTDVPRNSGTSTPKG